jgi:hypothetical protein
MSEPKKQPEPRTGLVCPACKQSTGVIENETPSVVVFVCGGVRPSVVDPRGDGAEALSQLLTSG